MLIPSHLQLEPSNSRTRVPAGGINLIASIDFESDESTTATLSSSTKVLQGDDAISSAQVATPNHSNQQFSIYAITDAAANISERYAYTAYGQPTILNAAGTVIAASAISNRYTYTAREWDATVGLHHFRARWMSGLTGRFLTRDPIGYRDGVSLYRLRIGLSLLDSTGGYIHDAFGNWCCEGDSSQDCCVTIKVRKPCRSVAVQIADNLLHGFPAEHGVNSGHAWIEGSCNNRWFRLGLWQDPKNPEGPGRIPDEGPIEQQFGVSHKKTFCGLCNSSFDCMFSSLANTLRNPPSYCLIDPSASGCANCASFVTDNLRGCGMQIAHASDPWQLARGAEQVGPCYPDGAGQP